VTGWSATTYAVLGALAAPAEYAGTPDAGVRMVPGTELLRERRPDPWWRSAVPDLAHEREVPPGFVDGWSFRTPVVEMPVYLDWLAARVAELGGTVTRLNLRALPEGPDVVVNCSGLGARLLGADRTVVPVRGQVVYVAQPEGERRIRRWSLDGAGPTYVVPRTHDVVVGGTDEEGDWSRTPSPATAADILRRATELEPRLRGARVLRHKVGLRPVRPAVRLERLGDVVHCYGHGGAGVTMSWGCADEVVALV
jgi:D-amino-acid oxidase